MLGERFWSKVNLSGLEDCWEWDACRSSNGYGMFWYGTRMHNAHRLVRERCFGPIPEGHVVRHTCDNPSCVNPCHLDAGTQSENILDAVSRGRHVVNVQSKLTAEDAMQIRALYEARHTQYEIADMFGVARSTIADVVCGRTWKESL